MTDTYKPKLIEVALPLAEISEASSKEKAVKQGHPANLHHWWARRPLASARAVLWASLVDDPSGHPDRFPTPESQDDERKRLFAVLSDLVRWENSANQRVIEAARREIAACFPEEELPCVLDPFGGGGAIPLEGQRLGLRSFSGDLNPVAVTIQRAMLEIPRAFYDAQPKHPRTPERLQPSAGLEGFSSDFQAYSSDLLAAAEARVGANYPLAVDADGAEHRVVSWVWARSVPSPDPSWDGFVPLARSWTLSKGPKRTTVWVEPIPVPETASIEYRVRTGGSPGPGTIKGGAGVCIATGATISSDYIRRMGAEGRIRPTLVAIVSDGGKKGRVFSEADRLHIEAASCVPPDSYPTGTMSTHPQYMGTPRFGLDDWHDLFTSRQLLTLETLCEELVRLREQIERDAREAGMETGGPIRDGGVGAVAYADAMTTYLSLAVDKLADLNNSLVRWEPVARCPRQLFGRQSVSMVWDFAEANPFGGASGSFAVVVDGIRKVLDGRGFDFETPWPAERVVEQRDARTLVKEISSAVICTDPPYYAQVPYADISDFFHVWLRRNLSSIWPDEFATLLTPKTDELVADERRHGSKAAAADFFERGIQSVFAEAKATQDLRCPLTIFYAFKQKESDTEGRTSTGWESFLQGLLDAGLMVTATWPIRTENKSRLRALGANALASSIVLACRPRPPAAPLTSRSEFISLLRERLPQSVRVLQAQNIAPVDLAQASIGPAIAIYSRFSRVVEAGGETMTVRTALRIINEILGEVLSAESAVLDPDSRFALTWFEQYGYSRGPYGDADVLARAKDTSVNGVQEAGIGVSGGGEFWLLGRDQLDPNWSALDDSRLTGWEAVQHLVRHLEESESRAAETLAALGGLADRARQLSYLLFAVCENKGHAAEASAYNGLISAWPDLAAQSSSPETLSAQQGALL